MTVTFCFIKIEIEQQDPLHKYFVQLEVTSIDVLYWLTINNLTKHGLMLPVSDYAPEFNTCNSAKLVSEIKLQCKTFDVFVYNC